MSSYDSAFQNAMEARTVEAPSSGDVGRAVVVAINLLSNIKPTIFDANGLLALHAQLQVIEVAVPTDDQWVSVEASSDGKTYYLLPIVTEEDVVLGFAVRSGLVSRTTAFVPALRFAGNTTFDEIVSSIATAYSKE